MKSEMREQSWYSSFMNLSNGISFPALENNFFTNSHVFSSISSKYSEKNSSKVCSSTICSSSIMKGLEG
ncbi:hypothetical protein LguiA_030545 [Lonicera macranthoides]